MGESHIAAGDCERIRPGWVAQPANTWSSLTYCAAGVWVWRRGPLASSVPSAVLGATAIAAGIGSVAYHGPGGRIAHVAHDGSAAALAVAVAAAATTAAARTATEERPLPRRSGWAVGAATAMAVGVAVHALSRTGKPLCAPDSWLQGHALWHALGATSVVLLAEAIRVPASDGRTRPAATDGEPDRPSDARP